MAACPATLGRKAPGAIAPAASKSTPFTHGSAEHASWPARAGVTSTTLTPALMAARRTVVCSHGYSSSARKRLSAEVMPVPVPTAQADPAATGVGGVNATTTAPGWAARRARRFSYTRGYTRSRSTCWAWKRQRVSQACPHSPRIASRPRSSAPKPASTRSGAPPVGERGDVLRLGRGERRLRPDHVPVVERRAGGGEGDVAGDGAVAGGVDDAAPGHAEVGGEQRREGVGAAAARVAAGQAGTGHQAITDDGDAVDLGRLVGDADERAAEEGDAPVDHVGAPVHGRADGDVLADERRGEGQGDRRLPCSPPSRTGWRRRRAPAPTWRTAGSRSRRGRRPT